MCSRCFGQACAVPLDFAEPDEELEAEGDGLGVDTVAAADHEGVLVGQRLVGEDLLEGGEALVQKVRGVDELQGQAGIQHVAGR